MSVNTCLANVVGVWCDGLSLRGSCSVNGVLTSTSPSMSGVEPCSRIKQLMMN